MRIHPFLVVCCLFVVGCSSVTARYVRYTNEHFVAKAPYTEIKIYHQNNPPLNRPYKVIGRVETSGKISDEISEDQLYDRAREIARKKGADAIINAKIQKVDYSGVYVEPGYTYGPRIGHHHWHGAYYEPPIYYPYRDTVLMFRGELIVYAS